MRRPRQKRASGPCSAGLAGRLMIELATLLNVRTLAPSLSYSRLRNMPSTFAPSQRALSSRIIETPSSVARTRSLSFLRSSLVTVCESRACGAPSPAVQSESRRFNSPAPLGPAPRKPAIDVEDLAGDETGLV